MSEMFREAGFRSALFKRKLFNGIQLQKITIIILLNYQWFRTIVGLLTIPVGYSPALFYNVKNKVFISLSYEDNFIKMLIARFINSKSD